jgi:hypothetical protein
MRTPRLTAALSLALAATLPNVVRAQVSPGDPGSGAAPVPPWERRSPVALSVGGGGLYQGARGSAPGRVPGGGGFDAFGGVAVGALALNVGYQQSRHALTGATATYGGVFVEPRVSVAPFRNFNPYVAARVSFLRVSAPADGRGRSTALGGGVGTLVAVAPGVHLDLTALYTNLGGAGAVSRSTSGVNGATLRAGLVLGLDRWNR